MPLGKVYKFSSFRLDSKECTLVKGNSEIELRPTAFEVLLFLVRNPQTLHTQAQIREGAWPKNRNVELSSVKDAITQIRKVLGDKPKKPQFIETKRSRGYRFIAEVVQEENLAPSTRPRIEPARLRKSVDESSAIDLYVGRKKQIALFQDLLKKIDSPRRKHFVLSFYGFAGVGKSTLMKIFRFHAEQAGVVIQPRLSRDQKISESISDWLSDIFLFEHDLKRNRPSQRWRDFLDILEPGSVIFIDTEANVNMRDFNQTIKMIQNVFQEEKTESILVTATRTRPHHRIFSQELLGLSKRDIEALSSISGWPPEVGEFSGKLKAQTDGNPFMLEAICLNEELWEEFKSGALDLGKRARPILYLLKEMWESLSEDAKRALSQVSVLAKYSSSWKFSWSDESCEAIVGSPWEDIYFELADKCFLHETPDGLQMHELVSEFAFRRLGDKKKTLEAAGNYYSSADQSRVATYYFTEAEQWSQK